MTPQEPQHTPDGSPRNGQTARLRTILVWGALWTGAGLFLLSLLFASLSLSLADILSTLFRTPAWLLAAVTAFAFANLAVGALKWQTAVSYLVEPAPHPGFMRSVEMTCLGEVFGQVIPVQLATLMSRWVLLGRAGRESGQAVRSTIFEQVFDLILVTGGTMAALAVLVLGLPPLGAIGVMVAVVGGTILALQPLLAAGARLFRGMASWGVAHSLFASAAEGFARAAAAPAGVLFSLAGWSLVRLVLVGLRATLVLAVFAPATPSGLVFVASPAVTLITALPLTPAGLGLAEWSWSAILVLGGTTASVAAIAALNIRLLNIVALAIILVGLRVTRPLRRAGTDARERQA